VNTTPPFSGFPCEPPAVETCSLCSTHNEFIDKNVATTIKVGSNVFLFVSVTVLLVLVAGAMLLNFYNVRKKRLRDSSLDQEYAAIEQVDVASTTDELSCKLLPSDINIAQILREKI